jgi:c-src tyrosine kinase
VDLKPNSLAFQKHHPTGNDPVTKSVKSFHKNDSNKNHHQRIARRYSTGEIIYNGMNSQTAAINLQQSGQTSIVSHHHAFPSTVTTTITTGNPNEPPRYAASQAIPTAPLRQHKRPAPQPGNGITLNNMLQQHRNVPPIQQQQQQQYAPHMNNVSAHRFF